MAAKARSGPRADRAPLLEALGVDLDTELLTLALTHRSYAYEHGGLPTNERLEFLGDSVLGVVVTEYLYRAHPDLPEGQLAKLRASVVNMHALAGVAATMSESGLGSFVYLGRGEELTGGCGKSSILADATEALIGAVYLQHGLETARDVIERLFADLLRAAPLLGAGLDWKTSLQELTAAGDLGQPEYRIAEDGPDHRKVFTATALVGGHPLGTGDGRTKKEAEQRAAEMAWNVLSAGSDSDTGGARGGTAGARLASERDGRERSASNRDGTDRAGTDRAGTDRAGTDRAGTDRDGSGERAGGTVEARDASAS